MAQNRLDLDLISGVDFGSDRSDLILHAGRRRLTPVTSSAAARDGGSPEFAKSGTPGVNATCFWVWVKFARRIIHWGLRWVRGGLGTQPRWWGRCWAMALAGVGHTGRTVVERRCQKGARVWVQRVQTRARVVWWLCCAAARSAMGYLQWVRR